MDFHCFQIPFYMELDIIQQLSSAYFTPVYFSVNRLSFVVAITSLAFVKEDLQDGHLF